jgi:hypothetical protein
MVGDSSSAGIYISSERNNVKPNDAVSRNSILRYDSSAQGTELTATQEWNLTADLPANGANLGLEAITWIQDSYLTDQNFFDDTKGRAYNPADYPPHGGGLFLVGQEATGNVYVYALNDVGGGFTRIATFSSGFTTVMDLQFDRDLNELWAVCDNSCTGRTHVLRLNTTTGKFEVSLRYERPATMPDTNNEGFAIAPATYCANGFKPAYWADDNDINGFSLRAGTLPCAAQIPPAPVVPEFPAAALSIGFAVAAMFGGWLIVDRRRRVTLS